VDFPARLRKAREIRDLSQSELAKIAGLKQSAVSHFESGRRQPSFHNLRRLADALKVPADFLLGRDVDLGSSGPEIATLFRDIAQLTDEDRQVLETVAKSMLQQRAQKNEKPPDE
jgi:transcriptional regulator with XRE-family HTH domain